MPRLARLFAAVVLLLLAAPAQAGPLPADAWPEPRPRLVLVVVVDQLRADTLTRFASRLLPARGAGDRVGGLRHLMQAGAWFPWAEHDVLQAMTGPGHATILTGAWPARTGIVLNDWFDRASGTRIYCTEDAAHPTLGPPGPPESRVPKPGRSPRLLRGGTLGDELKNAGLGSQVVAVALKDRAAILLGGHRADLALWFDEAQFRWTSSRFYVPKGDLPPWTQSLNVGLDRRRGEAVVWQATGTGSGHSDGDDRAGFVVRSRFGDKAALATPLGVELTVAAAEAALQAHRLGEDAAPDLLAVSFSTFDVVGHAHGPNSRQLEEMTVAVDQGLARLLEAVRSRVPGGLSQVLIAVTGDHGAMSSVAYLRQHRLPAGHLVDAELAAAVDKALDARFGPAAPRHWVQDVRDLHLWLDPRAAAAHKVTASEVHEAAATVLRALPGVAAVFTAEDVRHGRLPPDTLGRQIGHSFLAARSGDVIAVPEPWVTKAGDVAAHVTGYSYDRFVPLLLAGPHVQPGVYPQHVQVVDLAPTLAALLGVLPPPQSEGRVLHEAVGRRVGDGPVVGPKQ